MLSDSTKCRQLREECFRKKRTGSNCSNRLLLQPEKPQDCTARQKFKSRLFSPDIKGETVLCMSTTQTTALLGFNSCEGPEEVRFVYKINLLAHGHLFLERQTLAC